VLISHSTLRYTTSAFESAPFSNLSIISHLLFYIRNGIERPVLRSHLSLIDDPILADHGSGIHSN